MHKSIKKSVSQSQYQNHLNARGQRVPKLEGITDSPNTIAKTKLNSFKAKLRIQLKVIQRLKNILKNGLINIQITRVKKNSLRKKQKIFTRSFLTTSSNSLKNMIVFQVKTLIHWNAKSATKKKKKLNKSACKVQIVILKEIKSQKSFHKYGLNITAFKMIVLRQQSIKLNTDSHTPATSYKKQKKEKRKHIRNFHKTSNK